MAWKTIIDKVWDAHVVESKQWFPDVFYIDLHLIHEVTSPQAFTMLREKWLSMWRIDRTVGTADHNVPTKDQHLPIKDKLWRIQVETLNKNCEEFGVTLYGMGHEKQGIVHVIWPQLWLTHPGKTIVCGDSHTSTHGAFWAIAFGIWTSEVGHTLATQCLLQTRPKTMRINFNWKRWDGVYSKDLILYLISEYWFKFGTGYFVEYAGDAIRELSMEARMTICNMSIEFGARGGLIAPDQTTFDYLEWREFSPTGEARDESVAYRSSLPSDDDATFDRVIDIDVTKIEPMITYGTNPWMGIGISQHVPTETDFDTETEKSDFIKAMDYMWLTPWQPIIWQEIDYVFFGSCTNSRIEDFRLAASIIQGKKIASNVTARVVPWSHAVAAQAEKEWLKQIFEDAWFEFRGAGCSACLAMNEDKIPAWKYCVSTSNRNFQWRQWPWSRTFLASPATAAACALAGEVVDVRQR